MLQQAVDTYLEGQEWMAAAFTLEKVPGKADKAAEMFLKAGDYKKAAEIWSQNGKADKAAPLFEEKGNNLEAARLYALAEKWDKAAALFVKSGYPLKAAEAYEKQGDLMRAAESFEKHFLENVTFSTSYSGGAPSSETKNAHRAGALYEQAGAPEKAREIYLRGSFFKEAAAVSARIGQFAKAAEYYLRAEDLGEAADAFEKARRRGQGRQLPRRGRVQGRQAPRGGGRLPERQGLPAVGGAVRADRHAQGGRPGLRGRQQLLRGRRRLHPRGPEGPRGLLLREERRVRDRRHVL